jgi:hypothetical protein
MGYLAKAGQGRPGNVFSPAAMWPQTPSYMINGEGSHN